ncbi:MAG TPA: sugar ABC transporter substrate-binding protein [Longimicrobiales bacterium]
MRRLLFVCLLSAGCSQAAGDDATVTLRFWGLGREGEVVAEMIPQFEQENPGIRVHVQQIPWTAAHEKLLTSHVGRSTPDVAQLGNTWVPEFAAINALEPLDARVARSQTITRGAYFAGIWNTNLVDDTLFGVPWYVDTRVIFYRKDILAAAGYDSIPQDWAGWLRAMQAIKRNVGPDRYPIYLPTNEWAQPVIFGQQNGAALLRDGNNYGAFASPEFSEAFEFYVNMFRAGLAPAQGLYDVANPFQEFARGYFAMWITGPWNMGEMKRRLPPEMQGKWATSPMPGPDGAASGLSTAGGASLVLFRGSKHKDAAWKLIEFLSRTEQQVRFYELTGSLPARQEAWRRARLPEDEYARAFWTQLQRVTPLPAVPEIEGIVQRVAEHAESSIRGNVPTERALQAMDEDVDRMLEKRRWMARAQ